MKKVHWWGGTLGIVMTLALGCSSTPERATTAIETMDREEYVTIATRRLDDFEKEASDLEGNRRRDMMASISDARAEVRTLQSAPDWQRYRGRVQSRLDRIQNLSEAKAE